MWGWEEGPTEGLPSHGAVPAMRVQATQDAHLMHYGAGPRETLGSGIRLSWV